MGEGSFSEPLRNVYDSSITSKETDYWVAQGLRESWYHMDAVLSLSELRSGTPEMTES